MEGAHIMKRWMKDVPLTMDEIRALIKKKDKQSKWIWIGIGISIICSLIALVLWVRNRNELATEEYYEYFDDEDFDDFEDFDEEYEDDSEVEYVEITENDEDSIELPE